MSRFSIANASPGIYAAMLALADQLEVDATIPRVLRDLVECRVSQINSCSFCLRMHSQSYLDQGGDATKLTMLALWRVSTGFTPEERVALDWAEALTNVADSAEITRSHAALGKYFDPAAISQLTGIIATMNAWNRLGIAQHERA